MHDKDVDLVVAMVLLSLVSVGQSVDLWVLWAKCGRGQTEPESSIDRSLTWNKLWLPSPHGNLLVRTRKYSYFTNSGRWTVILPCSK